MKIDKRMDEPMTVTELITHLQAYPPDTPVFADEYQLEELNVDPDLQNFILLNELYWEV